MVATPWVSQYIVLSSMYQVLRIQRAHAGMPRSTWYCEYMVLTSRVIQSARNLECCGYILLECCGYILLQCCGQILLYAIHTIVCIAPLGFPQTQCSPVKHSPFVQLYVDRKKKKRKKPGEASFLGGVQMKNLKEEEPSWKKTPDFFNP